MRIPFVGPSYNTEARSWDAQRTVNLFPIMSESGTSKSVSALRKVAGTRLYATAQGGPHRGSFTSTTGRAYFVSAQYFVELLNNGSVVVRGTLNTQSSRVSIAENNTQIMVVDGTDGWIFTQSSNVWAQIVDTDFPRPAFVTSQDGYFVVPEAGTQKMWISALGDGMTWDALDFTSVESLPDDLLAVVSDNGNLWCYGNRSIEVYQNTGNASFPFERISGAIIQNGCEAVHTIQKLGNSLAWLGTDEIGQGVVWAANGYNTVRLSTSAIETRISSVGNFTTSYAWVYHDKGHTFYCLQIAGLDTTLVYDANTGQWHERSYKNTETNEKEQHRGACHVFFNKKHYIGDRVNGNIYELSDQYYDDNGDEMLWERVSPHIANEKQRLTFSSFELDMEVGVGKVSGQGKDPQVFLQYSDDGGFTWSSELWQTIGAIGDYSTRVCWRQLGSARDRVFRVAGSDPVFIQINDAFVNGT